MGSPFWKAAGQVWLPVVGCARQFLSRYSMPDLVKWKECSGGKADVGDMEGCWRLR